MLGITAALVIGGGFYTYSLIGAPGARDMPLAQRLADNAARYAEPKGDPLKSEKEWASDECRGDGIV